MVKILIESTNSIYKINNKNDLKLTKTIFSTSEIPRLFQCAKQYRICTEYVYFLFESVIYKHYVNKSHETSLFFKIQY